MKKKLTRFDLQKMKTEGRKAVWVTAYDFITAQLAEEAGMDMLLVGDSLGMAVYGYPGTVPVTMDQCIYHTEAVHRAAPNTFVIGDMPFGAYQAGVEDACRNAIRFHKEAGVDCLLRDVDPGTKGSLRSRGVIDVGAIAALLGGGGHHNAAGFMIPKPPDAAYLDVVDAVRQLS